MFLKDNVNMLVVRFHGRGSKMKWLRASCFRLNHTWKRKKDISEATKKTVMWPASRLLFTTTTKQEVWLLVFFTTTLYKLKEYFKIQIYQCTYTKGILYLINQDCDCVYTDYSELSKSFLYISVKYPILIYHIESKQQYLRKLSGCHFSSLGKRWVPKLFR